MNAIKTPMSCYVCGKFDITEYRVILFANMKKIYHDCFGLEVTDQGSN